MKGKHQIFLKIMKKCRHKLSKNERFFFILLYFFGKIFEELKFSKKVYPCF
jgi:hypothetical protein